MCLTNEKMYGILHLLRRGGLSAGIAQSVEQLIRNQQVVSSSLISSSRLSRTDFVRGSFFLKSRLRRGLKFPQEGLHCGMQLSRLCALQVGGKAALRGAERLFLKSGTGGRAVAQCEPFPLCHVKALGPSGYRGSGIGGIAETHTFPPIYL